MMQKKKAPPGVSEQNHRRQTWSSVCSLRTPSLQFSAWRHVMMKFKPFHINLVSSFQSRSSHNHRSCLNKAPVWAGLLNTGVLIDHTPGSWCLLMWSHSKHLAVFVLVSQHYMLFHCFNNPETFHSPFNDCMIITFICPCIMSCKIHTVMFYMVTFNTNNLSSASKN